MAWPLFLVIGITVAAAVLGMGAARREHATIGQIAQRRHHAGNFPEPIRLALGLAPHEGKPRNRGHQPVRVGMLRPRKQLLDRRLLDLASGIHHDDALRHFRHHAEIVGDEDYRGAEPVLQVDDKVEDLRLDGDIQRSRRLVGDQHLGMAGERHRDHGALPHAAGELVWIFLRPLFRLGDARDAQHLDRLRPGLRPADILVQ